ncbi:MAG: M61 family metallopeptidase [Phycisphaerales bacterium]
MIHPTLLASALLAGALVTLMAVPLRTEARAGARPASFNKDGPRVEYVVLTHEARSQVVTVSMIVRGVRDLLDDSGSLDVLLPVWRPGRYQVLDMAGTFRSVTARTGEGVALPCEKVDKATWRITVKGPATEEVIVDAVIYANSLADRTRHADDTHVFLSPAAAFLYVPRLRGEPCHVRVEAPPEWRVATGLTAIDRGANPRVFLAADYDVLVDSPLEIGLQEVLPFEVEDGERKVPHEIIFWTARPPPVLEPVERREHWDRAKLVKDFAAVVIAEREVFGDLPYQRYVYIVHCYPGGGGGTEHLNSTVMGVSPSRFDTADGHRSFMGLVSHEMFHTWNVKQLRPAGIKPYDYQRENYTKLLWVAEGTTSYYDDLVLVRAGITKPDDYLKTLGEMIDGARRRPGAGVQSLEDSSFDAWIKFNKPTPDAANSTVSFYDKGAQASMVLDMAVREASGNAASLDDVMRDLYKAFPLSGPGFTTDDVLAAVNTRAGRDMTELFVRVVRTTEPVDFEAALGVVGLEVVLKGEESSKLKAQSSNEQPEPGATATAHPDGSSAHAERAFLGLSVTDAGGSASVSAVASDGPAYAAGIIAGDTIIALNGERFRAGDLAGIEKRLAPGDMVKVTYFRYDAMREAMVTAAARPDAKWIVRRVKEPSDQQKAAYESWVKQTWPGDKKPEAGGTDSPPAGAKP